MRSHRGLRGFFRFPVALDSQRNVNLSNVNLIG